MRSEAGFLAIRQGDSQSAAQQFRSEQDQHPECSLAILGEARLLMDAGDNQSALQTLKELWSRDHGFFTANVSELLGGLSPELAQHFLNDLAQQSGEIDPGMYKAITQETPNTGQEIADGKPAATTAARNEAAQAYKTGNYGRCAALLRNTLGNADTSALQMLTACAFFTADYNLAYDAARALRLRPAYPRAEALYWSIKINERLAFASLDRFQQLEPNSARSHILLGDIYRQRERYDDAQKEYAKALDLSPNSAAALLGLASAYFGNGNINKTIETTQKALLQSPDDPEINVLMGEALLAQHQYADAEPYLLKGLHAKPQMLPHVHALLGRAYAMEGKDQDAIRELKLGADSDQDGGVHYLLARQYLKSGDKADADLAMQQMKALQQKSRENAVIAVQDSHPTSLDDMP